MLPTVGCGNPKSLSLPTLLLSLAAVKSLSCVAALSGTQIRFLLMSFHTAILQQWLLILVHFVVPLNGKYQFHQEAPQ